jgi:hypothetical protein
MRQWQDAFDQQTDPVRVALRAAEARAAAAEKRASSDGIREHLWSNDARPFLKPLQLPPEQGQRAQNAPSVSTTARFLSTRGRARSCKFEIRIIHDSCLIFPK